MPTTVMGGGGTGAYGSIPAPVNPQSTVGTATANAIGAGLNVYSQLPGYGNDMSNIGANIASETAGQVPDDVITQLKEQGAEGAISTGAASNASYLRALGLTSLGLEQTGLSNLEGILPTLPGAGISQSALFEPTTGQQLEAQQQNSLWASAPDPAAAARLNLQSAGAGIGAGLGSGNFLPPTPGSPQNQITTLPPPGQTNYDPMAGWTDAQINPWNYSGYAPGSPGALTNYNAWWNAGTGNGGTGDGSSGDDSTGPV